MIKKYNPSEFYAICYNKLIDFHWFSPRVPFYKELLFSDILGCCRGNVSFHSTVCQKVYLWGRYLLKQTCLMPAKHEEKESHSFDVRKEKTSWEKQQSSWQLKNKLNFEKQQETEQEDCKLGTMNKARKCERTGLNWRTSKSFCGWSSGHWGNGGGRWNQTTEQHKPKTQEGSQPRGAFLANDSLVRISPWLLLLRPLWR